VLFIPLNLINVIFGIQVQGRHLKTSNSCFRILSCSGFFNSSPSWSANFFSVLRRNAFFAHPENDLLAMLTKNREEIRTLAWRRIKEARTRKDPEAGVRSFKVPPLNLDAKDYVD